MKRKIIKSASLVALALGVSIGVAAPGVAVAVPAADGTGGSHSQFVGDWVHYYEHYFYTFSSCEARGRAVTGNRTGTGEIAGTTDWKCFLERGASKWSMDLYFANGLAAA